MEEKITVGFPKLGITGFDMDPVALRLGSVEIRWYGILILLGLLTAVFFGTRKMKKFDHTFDDVLDLLIFSVPAGIIGCRLYYCAFRWDYYKNDPIKIITGIFDGGLAFYGGLIGAVLAALIVMKVKKMNIPAILDLYITQFPIAQAIGRWGNFVNGEAYGGHTDLPWGMTIAQRSDAIEPVHPTFLYESLWNLIGFIWLYKHIDHRKFNGQNALLYLLWYGLGRTFIEGLRTDSLYIGNTGIRVSQLLSAIMVVVSIVLLIVLPHVKKARDARLAAAGEYESVLGDESLLAPFEETAEDASAPADSETEPDMDPPADEKS